MNLKLTNNECIKDKITDNCSNCGYQDECKQFDQEECDYYDNRPPY